MSEFLLYYKRPDPTTWVYLSSFLTIGLYFVFHRFWSIRNLDIVLLILLAPGLLMVHEGRRRYIQEMATGEYARARAERSETSVPSAYIVPSPLRELSGRPDRPESLGLAHIPSRMFVVARKPLLSQASGTAEAGEGITDPSIGTGQEEPTPSAPALNDSETSGETDSSSGDGDAQRQSPPLPRAGKFQTRAPPSAARSIQAQSIQAQGVTPQVTDPEDLDERLESTTLDPNQSESAAELSAKALQRRGFIFLFVVELLILIRLLADPPMVRRPLLDPNLTVGGLYFISISLFIFMMVNVATSTAQMSVLQGPDLGPGYALMHKLPTINTRPISKGLGGEEPASEDDIALSESSWWVSAAKVLAIVAHLAIIVGLVLIGNRHFGNLRAGVGCALLYLMLPYTAQMTGRVDHAVPAALLLWAVLCYRRPMVAGVFLGLAAGLVYYPLFLLPLWFSFYWQRGARRFGLGVLITLVILGALLSFGGTDTLVDHLRRMFGLFAPTKEPRGIWSVGWDPRWRLPVIVAFGILCSLFAIWPSTKNLGSLIGCSAAVMVAVQFWHGYGGGLYIAWFLPLLLLTIFRPNLQDRIAVKVVRGRSAESPRRSKSSGGVQAV